MRESCRLTNNAVFCILSIVLHAIMLLRYHFKTIKWYEKENYPAAFYRLYYSIHFGVFRIYGIKMC